MPATPITVNSVAQSGSAPGTVMTDPTPTAVDTVNGNSIANSGKTVLRVQNTDTSPHTVTIVPAESIAGLALQSDARVIPAGARVWIGHLDIQAYGPIIHLNCTSNLVTITPFEP